MRLVWLAWRWEWEDYFEILPVFQKHLLFPTTRVCHVIRQADDSLC
jgi:hypothetical protein